MDKDVQDNFDEKSAFEDALNEAAEYAAVPKSVTKRIGPTLFETVNNPRSATKIFEKEVADSGWCWPEAIALLRAEGKKETLKNQCEKFISFVMGKWYFKGQLFRAARVVGKRFPCIEISQGPSRWPCPDHADYDGLLLPSDTTYLRENPLRKTLGCKCTFRLINKWEYERMKNQ
ncbi:hypothetical protein [Oceanobacter antarcticus]|uniref:Phage Mu protein F like protein n=1 Tax=Oceanobacter antarcticus TaxID=3133425 RepID=A0ABW8NFA6_9GAMM